MEHQQYIPAAETEGDINFNLLYSVISYLSLAVSIALYGLQRVLIMMPHYLMLLDICNIALS